MAEIKFDETTKGYDYYGTVTNVAARTEAHGDGGQVCVTEAVLAALGSGGSDPYLFRSLGHVTLRGVDRPIELHDVVAVPGRDFKSEAAAGHEAPSGADGGKGLENQVQNELLANDRVHMYEANHSSDSSSMELLLGDGEMGQAVHLTRSVLSTALSACDARERLDILKTLQARWRAAAARAGTDEALLMSALARRVGKVVQLKAAEQRASAAPARNS
jgi:hypothetical protein